MTKFNTLSTESERIVKKFFNAVFRKRPFIEANKRLMLSLYKTKPGADRNVLDVLKEFHISVDNYLSKDELASLMAEYEAVIYYCSQWKGPIIFNTDIPTSLVELCGAFFNPEKEKSTYFPFAGEIRFAPLCKTTAVEGFEISPEAWAFSQIVLKSINPHGNILLSDLNSELATEKKFDYIFSFPPFFLQEREKRKVIDIIYKTITQNLNENGEFYAILPMSYCNDASGWFDVRKIMLDHNGFSTMVIALPSILLPSNINLCLVYFAKINKELVILVDATSEAFLACKDVAGCFEFTLKVQSIKETIEKQDERYVWVGDVNNLSSNLDMNPARYLISQNVPQAPKGQMYFKLRELISLVGSTKEDNRSYNTPVLGMKDLSTTYLNCVINYKNITTKLDQNNRILEQDALLAGFTRGKFKVGRISDLSNNINVSLRPEVFAFKITSDKITDDYLLRSLLSGYTERQAKAMASGITLTCLNIEDFLDIIILVPSIKEQDKLCKEDIRISLSESNSKIIDAYEEYRMDMHMKKHAIGQTIFNLNNWWKVLMKVRKESDGIVNDSSTIGENLPVRVSEIYDNLQAIINQIQRQINTFDRGNGHPIKNMALTEFIEEYIEHHQSPLFRFVYYKSKHHATCNLHNTYSSKDTGVLDSSGQVIFNEENSTEYAEFAPEALTIIFDNIVSNACSHGFAGREGLNLIKIDLISEGDDYVITIANNGLALHNQISGNDVFTYGKTSQNGKNHFGIGGYEVKRLMKEFDGDALIISDPESDFPVTYKLIFHKTNFTSL